MAGELLEAERLGTREDAEIETAMERGGTGRNGGELRGVISDSLEPGRGAERERTGPEAGAFK